MVPFLLFFFMLLSILLIKPIMGDIEATITFCSKQNLWAPIEIKLEPSELRSVEKTLNLIFLAIETRYARVMLKRATLRTLDTLTDTLWKVKTSPNTYECDDYVMASVLPGDQYFTRKAPETTQPLESKQQLETQEIQPYSDSSNSDYPTQKATNEMSKRIALGIVKAMGLDELMAKRVSAHFDEKHKVEEHQVKVLPQVEIPTKVEVSPQVEVPPQGSPANDLKAQNTALLPVEKYNEEERRKEKEDEERRMRQEREKEEAERRAAREEKERVERKEKEDKERAERIEKEEAERDKRDRERDRETVERLRREDEARKARVMEERHQREQARDLAASIAALYQNEVENL